MKNNFKAKLRSAPSKIIYLWDLADTLFMESWQTGSGFLNYEEYLKSLGFDLNSISPKDFEWAYERPYKEGWLNVELAYGFEDILSKTKNNFAFTTGNKEQLAWRAERIKRKKGLDILPFFSSQIYSTFDYGNLHIKTAEMFNDLVKKLSNKKPLAIVYADNQLNNCKYFISACQKSRQPFRCYHAMHDRQGLRPKKDYWEIGGLYDILNNEEPFKS